MKLEIIIQGPIITYGQGPNNSKNGFDSNDAILYNINNAQTFSDAIVVSTWDPNSPTEVQLVSQLNKKFKSILCLSPPTLFDPDNRFKHYFGILKGMEYLLSVDCNITHFVKIRTDMQMPMSFWNWIYSLANSDTSRLYVSELSHEVFYMGDFIYFGCVKRFSDFINIVVKNGENIFHPSIASDIGIKYGSFLAEQSKICLSL